MPSEISFSDIWESVSRWGQNGYYHAKKLNKFHWGMILGIPLLYFFSREKEAEEYAINYLEDEISRNSS